ncbi:MAG: RNA polymerase sigma factor [Candidatus Cyclobacteriaceae bacterium M3_2C_046]
MKKNLPDSENFIWKSLGQKEDLEFPQINKLGKKFSGKTDREIWAAFKDGEEAAFIHIYSTYFQQLLNYGHQFTKHQDLVEDCIQDLFVDLRIRRAKLAEIKLSIRLYLFKSLKRRIIEYLRDSPSFFIEHDNLSGNQFEVSMSIEENLINKETIEATEIKIKNALQKLSDREREAIYYIYFKNFNYEETKVLMNMDNVKSVRNLVYKAAFKLKNIIKMIATYFIFYLAAH